MTLFDTLTLPGTRADKEQVKCWWNQMRNVKAGDTVPALVTVKENPYYTGDDPDDQEYIETYHCDYVIVMRCDGCLVVRGCILQGYFLPAALIPNAGGQPVGALPQFDKWGEPWVDAMHNCGLLGEPYFYRLIEIGRSINETARGRPAPSNDQDERVRY